MGRFNQREEQAAEAYLKFLKSKGAPTGILYKRSRFLDRLMDVLRDKALTRKDYALALESIIDSVPTEDRKGATNTAREYFLFWTEDVKGIASFHGSFGFSTKEIDWEPEETTLARLTKKLGTENFNEQERQSLDSYLRSISNLGAAGKYFDSRNKLARIVLLRLKGAPIKDHSLYRMAADLTLPLFKTEEISKLYLEVVREFYYFWTNDPNAEELTFGKEY